MVGRKSNTKVFVGLSGGVDSAVSAALLQSQGYDVVGVFIKIQVEGYPCPAAKDRLDAMRVAAYLRIPFVEVDLSSEYTKEVFKPSISEYKKGRTPNPDTLCNEKIKFGVFYEHCRSKGAEFVATGHYAQVKNGLLYASIDLQKDQSYFLWMISQSVLEHVLFPVGGMTKVSVRALAKKFGLPNAVRPDSQGLCFLGDISIDDMLTRELSHTKGSVLSESGEVVGEHDGAVLYTLGERHGFMLFKNSSETLPHYVIAKDIKRNTITVSPERFPTGATGTRVLLEDINWIGEVPQGNLKARYRYRQALISATFENESCIILNEPHYVPEGQSLVLYHKDRCLGGGVISNATLTK